MRFSRDQRSITLRGPPRHVATSFPRTDFSNEVGHLAVTQEFNMHKHLLTYDSESTHSLLISIPEVSEEYVYFKWDRGSKIKSSAFSQRGRDSESLIHLMSLMYNSHVLMSAVWSSVCLPTLFSAIWLRSEKITVQKSPEFRRKHGKYCANRLVNTGKRRLWDGNFSEFCGIFFVHPTLPRTVLWITLATRSTFIDNTSRCARKSEVWWCDITGFLIVE